MQTTFGSLCVVTIVLVLVKAFVFNSMSWWLVFAPLWVPIAITVGIPLAIGAIVLVIFLIVLLILGICILFDWL